MASLKTSKKTIALHWILVAPLVLQGIGTAGLIGFFAYHTRPAAIADQSQSQTTQDNNPRDQPKPSAVQNNAKRALLLSELTFLLSTTASIVIARRINRSLQHLSQASQAMAQGGTGRPKK